MYQKDFILRMIEMIGELIAGVLGMIKKGDFQQAAQTLDDAYFNFLKEDASLLKSIKNENLTNELIQEHNYKNGHLEILSELFFAEAELLQAQGKKKESLAFYEKSIILFEFNLKHNGTFSFEKQAKLTMLKTRLGQLKGNIL